MLKRKYKTYSLILQHDVLEQCKTISLMKISDNIRRCSPVIKKMRDILYMDDRHSIFNPELHEYHKSIGFYENDRRRGWETYGYSSEESIRMSLERVSDDCDIECRLTWLLDLPPNYKKLRKSCLTNEKSMIL